MGFGLTLVTPPAAEPLTLGEAKPWLRVDDDDSSQDAVIELLVKGARERCERVCGLSLITQAWRLTLDAWPAVVRLPRGPVQSITSVQYYDSAGVLQTLSTDDYEADLTSLPARLWPAEGLTWPDLDAAGSAVQVNFVAGYGAAGSAVPADVRRALLACVSHQYHRREDPDEAALDRLFAGFWDGGYV